MLELKQKLPVVGQYFGQLLILANIWLLVWVLGTAECKKIITGMVGLFIIKIYYRF